MQQTNKINNSNGIFTTPQSKPDKSNALFINPSAGGQSGKSGTQYLKVETEKTGTKDVSSLQNVLNKINAASNINDILLGLIDDINAAFNSERVTIFIVDGIKRELASLVKSGKDIEKIHVPVNTSSIAGYVAFKQKNINIKNAYDKTEISTIDPNLFFDTSWDIKTGFTTKQVLAAPIIFKSLLLGVIQIINQKELGYFTDDDEQSIKKLATFIGVALYNQKRDAKGKLKKFEYLLENYIISQKELKKAIAEASKANKSIEFYLITQSKIPLADIKESLSKFYKTEFIVFNNKTAIPGELLRNLKIPFLRKNIWVPYRSEGNKIFLLIDNPHDLHRIDVIKSLFRGKEIIFKVAIKEDILKYIDLFTQDEKKLAGIDAIISQLTDEDDEIDEDLSSVDEEDNAIVMLVNKIIYDAHARRASDIHIEPFAGKENTRVRIRVDGSCTVYQTVPYSYRNALVSRIKIMSDLDIAERRKPQSGKIKFKKYGGLDIELRVETIPTAGGMEDVVMRILAAGEPIPLINMGFSKKNFENFVSIITKPYGIIFVCGPTGSGKTTTLHSAMGFINKTETKIWTAEDPVEITQRGLRQVQVKPKIGFDFAAAMRSFLRADPDVIMVGEMRDKETTQIGIEASLTGHLVLTTLHTNSAPESITRLLDMGMDPFNFADAILGILAQRLVRTLCKACKESYNPSKEEYDELVREYGEEDFNENVKIEFSDDLTLYKPKGCDSCNDTGYSGRMGIHELLIGTDEQKRLIQSMANVNDLRKQAIKDGMSTLKQDGIEKIFQGKLDLLQVRKVCIK